MLVRGLLTTLAVVALAILAIGCTGPSTPTTTPPSTGSLHVLVLGADSIPLAGAKVVSNTQPEGQLKVTGSTQSDGTVTYNDIKAGEYEFYISRFDYEQKEFGVGVAAGQTATITITLVRTPAPLPTAS